MPVTKIFNTIIKTSRWPKLWKTEYVTITPKNKSPESPAECRNISCTNFLSKIFESFVLQWSREQVVPKLNQYGGEPGASSTQMLVEVVDDVTSALEDNRAAVVLSALDFSIAFNRLDHTLCLESFASKGASTEVLALLASFLTGRNMTVRVGNDASKPRCVNAGAPKGSVLGCYLFNIGIDSLEEDFQPTNGLLQRNAVEETLSRTDDFPVASTPSRVRPSTVDAAESPIANRQHNNFKILPRVANIPPWIRKPKDPVFKEGRLKTYKYVDDELNTSVINMRKASLLMQDGVFFKEVTDLRTEGILQHISDRARLSGMKINALKTNLMCVSAAYSFRPRVSVTLDNQKIDGRDNLKLLGVTVDSDMSFKSHIETISARLRSRTWALAKLRKKGLDQAKLVKAYTSLIRPVCEYACPAWQSLLTADQSEKLERQQSQALKNIFVGISASKMRDKAGIALLSKRREKICSKFSSKCINNIRTRHWFQERRATTYSRRMNINYPRYLEPAARTNRFRNSPKNDLIRLLNK